jgi:hypothetical protein
VIEVTIDTPEDASLSINTTIAGFIVWLARQDRQLVRNREDCAVHVTRYLYWRRDQRAAGNANDEGTYCDALARDGEPAESIAEARTATALLRRYRANATI